MGKKDVDIDKVLKEAIESLPTEVREVIEKEGIKSMADLFVYALSNGIDPDKLSEQEFACDNDDMDDGFLNGLDDGMGEDMDDEWGFGSLPEGLLLDSECKEYHIRVKLNDAPVKIWRELVVPSNMSLELLAKLLIEAMGWEDCHLHQFCKNGVCFKSTRDMENDKMFADWGNRFMNRDANTVALCHVLQEKGDRMKFEYDFGDSWEHDVWVKGVREYSAEEKPDVRLLKGKGACPPEDCGGVWGYGYLLEILQKKRKTAEDKERLDWYGMDKHFEPEAFDLEEMQGYIEDWWEDVRMEIEDRKDKGKE